MKKVKITNAILCEHVAQGANNKHILINTYSGDIVVETLPAQIMFGVYIEVELPIAGVKELELEISYGGKVQVGARAAMGANKGGERGILAIPLIPMSLTGPGTLEIHISSVDFGRTLAIRKSITQGDTSKFSTVTRRPSGRSRSASRAS